MNIVQLFLIESYIQLILNMQGISYSYLMNLSGFNLRK